MSLRDRLRARQLATVEARIPADPGAYADAERYVVAATRTLQLQQAAGVGLDDLEPYRSLVEQAQAALDGQAVEVFTLRCLPPVEWEALVEAHPPADDQRKRGWLWNIPAFRPAVLAACVMPAEGEESLGERGWVEVAEEGQMAPGELDLLFVTAVNLNASQPQVSTGKG